MKSVGLEALEEEIEHFEPQVVICSGFKTAAIRDILVWIDLSLDPTSSTKIRSRERCFERINPTLQELLKVIDEVE